MSEFITFNGSSYIIPDLGDENWGQNVTNFLVAIPAGALQKTGGLFPLTADVNIGPTFGLITPYLKSPSNNIATAGIIRLAKSDLIEWRNNANLGNNILGTNAADQLTYNGTPLEFNALMDSHIFVGNVSNVATDVAMTGDIGITDLGATSIQAGVIVNADVNASAAIAYSKLALTGSIVNNDIDSAASIVYSKLALSNGIVNTDINTSAAIAYSKLNLTGDIVNADISSVAAIVYSKLSLTGDIVNSDINTSAAIAYSKLAALTASKVLVSDGSGLVSASSVTTTSLGYLDATSSIQTQLNGKQATLTPGAISTELRVDSSSALYFGADWINVRDYGAVGNGIADDTTAIQNALNAAGIGTVFFPVGIYNISSTLQLVYGNTLLGGFGSTIIQTASAPLFRLVTTTSTGAEYQSIHISGFSLSGGTDILYAQNGGVNVILKDLYLAGFSAYGIHMRGFIQNWICDNIRINPSSSGYGIYFNNQAGLQSDNITTGTPILLDKNSFNNFLITGGINAILIDVGTRIGTSNNFDNLIYTAQTQNGMVLNGFLRNTTFTNMNTENIGISGPTAAYSTATTIAGNASVTVASGTNFVNGQVVTIQGAGTNGADWYPTISSGGGTTTLVMTTTAPTSVTSQSINNFLYCDVIMGIGTGSANSPIDTIFIGCDFGGGNSGLIRYGVDGSATVGSLFLNCLNDSYLYDPNSVHHVIGGDINVLRKLNYVGQQLFNDSFSGGASSYGHATIIGSPEGGDIALGLVDSNGVGTGTYGKITVRTSATGSSVVAPEILSIGSTGLVTAPGGVVNGQAQVQGTTTTATSTTSSTYQVTALSASITPKSTSHRIKVTVSGELFDSNIAVANAFATLARGGSNLLTTTGFAQLFTSGVAKSDYTSFTYIDSPASTSALTYAVYIRNDDNITSVSWNIANTTTSIILEEIV